MTMIELHRGDVVLVAFPVIAQRQVQWKRRPALVVQADRYNRRRAAVIIAAITSARAHQHLPCKLPMRLDGRTQPTIAIFGDPGSEALLGVFTLEGFGLAADPVNRRLVPVPGLLK